MTLPTVKFQVGSTVKLAPTAPHRRDGGDVVVTRVHLSPAGELLFDYTDPRNGGCRTALANRIQTVRRKKAEQR